MAAPLGLGREKAAVVQVGGEKVRDPTYNHDPALPELHDLARMVGENANPRKAELVKLRFFAGLTMPEAAAALGVSLATAERYWIFARTWLYAELSDGEARSAKKAETE